jgi:alpha-L-rhamnosidase
VTVWDAKGAYCSAVSSFETAFLSVKEWLANWIEPEQEPAHEESFVKLPNFKGKLVALETVRMNPAQMVRKDFVIEKSVEHARIYITAHGVYYFEINGRRVGDMRLTPGYTSYNTYLEYQTYDITDFLEPRENAIGIVVGDGWYCGKVGMPGGSCQFGNRLALLFQIELEYEDGTRHTICSDGSCTSSTGPIQYSDVFVGEKYDARYEQVGFSAYGFKKEGWRHVQKCDYGYANLRAQHEEPVRILETLKPKEIWISPKGEIILDVGQVIAGHLRMRVRGKRGTKVSLEHTETIDQEGNFLFNIQGVFTQQTDIYILKGEGEEVFEPEFTYHGFRYVRITGYPGKPTTDDFDVQIVGSDLKTTGSYWCSDERLNMLQHNIFWSQRSNMVSIPTDCPQREKQGWTGDAQIYSSTACFNMDMAAFFQTWLRNMRLDQLPDGQVPNVVPYIKAYRPGRFSLFDTHCSAGWGDASIIIPWTLYQAYGERAVLEENYAMMQRWVAYIQRTAETELPENIEGEMTPERRERMRYLWNTHYHLGDWLIPSLCFDYKTGDIEMQTSANRTKEVVPTCYYAYSTELLAKIAKILGKDGDASKYERLNKKIKKAFAEEYIDKEGNIRTGLQGIYVLALKMDLVPRELRSTVAKKLVSMIHDNKNRLDTGFLSVCFLLDVLKDEGHLDVAYDLLFQDECPSWLYEVKMGATTIWESWQAVLPDGTNTTVSRNHYAFGCVGDWMYRVIGGMRAIEPGYKAIEIKPELDARLSSAHIVFDSVYGKIEVEWCIDDGTMRLKLVVPANTNADIYLPCARAHTVRENGIDLVHSEGISDIRQLPDSVNFQAIPGTYDFFYILHSQVHAGSAQGRRDQLCDSARESEPSGKHG